MVKDPVCGMEVDPKTASFSSVYNHKTYYFCSQDCKFIFDEHSEKYAIKQLEEKANEHTIGCGCEVKYVGPSFYLWLALIIFFIVFLSLSWLLR
jgi:YHS domain-containing protein